MVQGLIKFARKFDKIKIVFNDTFLSKSFRKRLACMRIFDTVSSKYLLPRFCEIYQKLGALVRLIFC